MIRNASHKPLYKRIHTKFIVGETTKVRVHVAPPLRYFTEVDIQAHLELVGDELEKKFPEIEWRLVELAPNRFNFIGEKKEPVAPKPVEQ